MLKLKDAFLLIWNAAPKWAVARVTILLLQSLLPLASLYLIKLVIDVIDSPTPGASQGVFQRAFFFLVIFVAVNVGLSACNAVGELVNAAQSQRVVDYVETRLYSKAIEIDLEHYESPQYYDILQRARRESASRPNQILQHSAALLQGLVSLIAVLGLLLSVNWLVAGILILASFPVMLVRLKYAGTLYHWQKRRTEKQRLAGYFGGLLATNSHAKEIRLFNLGKVFLDRFLSLRQQLYREQLVIVRQRAIASLASQTISSLVLLAVYGFLIHQTIEGILKISDLILYQQAFNRGQNSLSQFIKNSSLLYEDNLFLANLSEFMSLQPKISSARKSLPAPRPIKKGIVFHDVSFQYPGTSRVALKNVNLSIRPGETIALVGKNGSGKTTLIKLLCRLYDVTSGSITVDGVDIRDIERKELHRQISVVFQDFSRYNVSAKDNIWFGDIELSPNATEIELAAKRSGAHEVIESLDGQYQAVLGKLFSHSEELSGGQWQKVALARAFLRDSQLIVLDEPTSAMDPKAEEMLFQSFRELIRDQAAILVTHRLSTVTMADQIYVMAGGSIVEQGTHLELMDDRGMYADLFETQAKKYRL